MNSGISHPLRRWLVAFPLMVFGALSAAAGLAPQQTEPAPVQVTIKDEKAVVGDGPEAVVPVDPVRRINYQPQGLSAIVSTDNGQPLELSHSIALNIDGQVLNQGQGAQQVFIHRPLGKDKNGKDREGFTTSYIYRDGLHVTATVTVVATKANGKEGKRRRDALLTHYLVENKGTKPRKMGLRMYMDTYVINNDGCLFAAPTMPGKVLDGVILKDKQLPPYVQLLQNPDLKNPGFVAHLTLDLGPKLDKADRVVLTRLGTAGMWDVTAMQAMGDSAMALFWEPKEIKPGGKREFAYGYGQGLVPNPESEGRVVLDLGGSFAPGKLFSVTAYVHDPAQGQSLALELPAGMTLVDGPEVQPVPAPAEGEASSLVFWRARVLRPGLFPVRVRSSLGVTQGKVITVTAGQK